MASDKNQTDKLARDIKDKVLARPAGSSGEPVEYRSVHEFMTLTRTGTPADARQFRLAVKAKGIAIWPDDDPRVGQQFARDGIRWEVRLKTFRPESQDSFDDDLDEKVSPKRFGYRRYGAMSRPDQKKFSDRVYFNCMERCVVTGVKTKCRGEAAHLIEHHKAGSDHWSNGLWLRADIHRLYDNGLCAINPSTLTIHFHPTILAKDDDLIAYEARPILPTRKPVNPAWLKSRWDELTWPK
ncbi:HNH endonuclease signature motif containing protein [Citrobacter freundii]|uniref:HNH endonuclease signature motif containing protein n=1 Tax=Citrobacter freundii TaxID=546 RepID=UPI0037C6EB95